MTDLEPAQRHHWSSPRRHRIEIDGPPDTITIRINAAEDLEEELGIVVKDRRRP